MGGSGPCGQAIFCKRDVLSEDHCWIAPDSGAMEISFFVNHLVPGSFHVSNPREARLMQVLRDLLLRGGGGQGRIEGGSRRLRGDEGEEEVAASPLDSEHTLSPRACTL